MEHKTCYACGAEMEYVYRFLACDVGEAVSISGSPCSEERPTIVRESEDGANGVWYECPHCGAFVTLENTAPPQSCAEECGAGKAPPLNQIHIKGRGTMGDLILPAQTFARHWLLAAQGVKEFRERASRIANGWPKEPGAEPSEEQRRRYCDASTLGQMMEPVSLDTNEVKQYEKPWALTGTRGKRKPNLVNSLFLNPLELEAKNFERYERYEKIEQNETMCEEYMMDDAEIALVAYGITSRVSKNAVELARKEGIKAGLIRPITIWPFPKQNLLKAANKAKAFITVELSMGQLITDVELAIRCKKPVYLCNRTGGMIVTTEQILEKIREINKSGGAN